MDRLREIPDCSIDAIVTDPPYGLGEAPDALAMLRDWLEIGHHDVTGRGFMGKEWDSFVPQPVQWRECLRVLKPGGHLLAFAGTRTQDLMGLGLRLAGFQIRDMLAWLYGSGFPKSLNLGDDWEGWGTALKPALEPVTLARKAPDGTIRQNVLKWHTGALNIDASRIHSHDSAGYAYQAQRMAPAADQNRTGETHQKDVTFEGHTKDGRWPANVLHDGSPEVLQAFPAAKGAQAQVTGTEPTANGFSGPVKYSGGFINRIPSRPPRQDDTTSAARFFYCAKTSAADRNEGCEHLPDQDWQHEGACVPERDKRPFNPSKNNHPTVKPTDLMRYLCRLITPPGGLILDPFLGSGSTGKAALLEGFRFIGIEKSADYLAIARSRIAHVQPSLPL